MVNNNRWGFYYYIYTVSYPNVIITLTPMINNSKSEKQTLSLDVGILLFSLYQIILIFMCTRLEQIWPCILHREVC